MIFNTGRVLSYTVLGLIVGFLGHEIIGSTNQIVASIAFSAVVVAIGLLMMFKEEKRTCEAGHRRIDFVKRLPENNDLKAFVLGISIALIPCAGLLTVFGLSAVSFHPLTGAIAGLLFGIGSMLSPLLAIGAGAGWFAKKVQVNSPNLRIWVKRLAGGLLVFIGLVMFFMILI
jgi:sulfite exporter TauE/SafE